MSFCRCALWSLPRAHARHMRVFAGLLVGVLSTAATGQSADSAVSGARARVRLGLGLGTASMSSGGVSGSSFGPLIGGQVSFVTSRTCDFAMEVLAQPFRVQNPNRDEAFRAYHIMVGWQFGSASQDRLYIRPSVGMVHRPWSGTDVWVSSESSIALGVAIGVEQGYVGRIPLVTEAFVLLSGGDELSTTLIGTTLNASSARRRRQ